MELKFKKLHENAVIPSRANPTDAGLDLTATEITEDNLSNILTIHTGIAVEIPEGHVGLLFPRSSVYKKDLQLANSVGVIDSDYRGEVQFKYRMIPNHKSFNPNFIHDYNTGERVGQLVIVPIVLAQPVEVEELNNTTRGQGGFGSTGE